MSKLHVYQTGTCREYYGRNKMRISKSKMQRKVDSIIYSTAPVQKIVGKLAVMKSLRSASVD